jgi:nucleotide-binding universal stress UspA family protein
MFSKILVPLDGSQLAEQVLPYVQSLAQRTQAAIVLLRVADHPARQYYVEGLAVNATQSDDSRTHCEAYLHRIAESLNNTDILVNYIVKDGAIADVILDYANEIQVDLIAMSTHGRTGIGRWLLGSVADRVVHGSHIPILLIRGQVAENAAPIAEQSMPESPAPVTDTLLSLLPFSTIH